MFRFFFLSIKGFSLLKYNLIPFNKNNDAIFLPLDLSSFAVVPEHVRHLNKNTQKTLNIEQVYS